MVTNGTIHFLKISLVGFPKSHFKTNSVAILTTYFTVPDFTEIREEVIFCSKICIIFILELQKKLHLSLSTVKGNCNEIFDNKGDFVIWIFFDFSTKMTHQTICQIFFSQTNFQKTISIVHILEKVATVKVENLGILLGFMLLVL